MKINFICAENHKWVGGLDGNYCPVCAREGFADETEEENAAVERDEERAYAGGGWPGDGSGICDFEDFNQNEVEDYRDE